MTNNKQTVTGNESLILASGSPRRTEILNAVGWTFEKEVPDVDESVLPNELPDDYVRRLALKKAHAVASTRQGRMVLGADTTVVVDGEIVGKPVDRDDALRMIRMLAGRAHSVLTGVALVRDGKELSDVAETRVFFEEMNEEEVEFLVENGEPMDKAGAYAVQAQAALFIEKIEGDYWNVVGLPVSLVYKLYKSFTDKAVASSA